MPNEGPNPEENRFLRKLVLPFTLGGSDQLDPSVPQTSFPICTPPKAFRLLTSTFINALFTTKALS